MQNEDPTSRKSDNEFPKLVYARKFVRSVEGVCNTRAELAEFRAKFPFVQEWSFLAGVSVG